MNILDIAKDPTKVSDEYITQAYQYLKEYCDKENKDVMEVINNDENIKPASIQINKQLPFLVRKLLSAEKIESLIRNNLDFIREKVKENYEAEHKPKKTTKKSKSKV